MAEGGREIVVSDFAQLRAMAHPARWTVLEALYGGVPLTATEAAELTGLTPSAMSYHLQQLAKLGLVERAPASDDGRQRPWRAVGTSLQMTAQPDAEVGAVMMQHLLARVSAVVLAPPPRGLGVGGSAASSEEGEARPWPAAYVHDRLRLSRTDASALLSRVQALVDEFRASEDPQAPERDVFFISGVRAG